MRQCESEKGCAVQYKLTRYENLMQVKGKILPFSTTTSTITITTTTSELDFIQWRLMISLSNSKYQHTLTVQ
jgi:hypothetical protein